MYKLILDTTQLKMKNIKYSQHCGKMNSDLKLLHQESERIPIMKFIRNTLLQTQIDMRTHNLN